jgi:hypothetical protein
MDEDKREEEKEMTEDMEIQEGGCGTSKEKFDKVISEDDSEDSGPYFEDLLSPGGEHLHFGTWKLTEIQKIARMQVNEDHTVAFNEYGSNLIKYKYDPLMVIEAKFAMTQEKNFAEGSAQEKGKQMTSVEEGARETNENMDMLVHPSPGTGTQEGPGLDLSSQEEMGDKERTGNVKSKMGLELKVPKCP